MDRAQLEHAIRAASLLVELDQVIVVGSQSILGTWDKEQLPDVVTYSQEVDIFPLSPGNTERLAEKLSILGEMSSFDQEHGFHLDGVDETSAILPAGWHTRLVSVPVFSVVLQREVEGLCLDPHDLCVAKIVAFVRRIENLSRHCSGPTSLTRICF